MGILRRLQLLVVLTFAIGLSTPLLASAQSADLTCDDFTSQEAAQIIYDLGPGADIEDELDPDGNGIACEDLPSREGGSTTTTNNGSSDLPKPRGSSTATVEATEETTETPSRSSRNAMNARFGGTRDSFEEEYGEPAGDDVGEYPLGFDYDVEGFSNVNVYYHKDYIAYVTLEAERRGAWSEREADRVVEDFLPTDVEIDDPFETDDGDLLTPAHSQALEKRFGDGTYKQYGATGDLGDLYYLFRFDRNGDVDTIEIALGNDLQGPPIETPVEKPTPSSEGSDLTPEERAYLQDLRTQFDAVATSMDQFSEILDGLNAGTLDAGAAGGQLRTVFDTWRQAQADAASLNPPASQQATHDLYIEMVDLLANAADDYTNGLVNSDQSLLEAGDEKYNRASIDRILLDAILTGAGV